MLPGGARKAELRQYATTERDLIRLRDSNAFVLQVLIDAR